MSKIVLNYENQNYELEFNRQSVKLMESQGFVLDEITSKPMTMIPLLFSGAFIKNCKGVKRNTIDKMFDSVGDKTSLMQALMEMYAETLSTLTDDAGEGNVSWTLVK